MAHRSLVVAVALASCAVPSAAHQQGIRGVVVDEAVGAAATTSAPISSASLKPLENYNLRILPLGDSITYGLLSTTGDGYRNVLRNDLLDGNAVNLIGSQQHGTMQDPNNEGHSGYRIQQIGKVMNDSLADNPDVVLLHAGTNDCIQSFFLDTAPARLGSLIDQILEILPQTAVLVAQIIGTPNATVQANIDAYNAQVPGVVQQRASSGSHVMTVDMSHLLDTSSDFSSVWHPNDQGYAKMGNAWFQGLQAANANGWIQNASASSVSVSENPSATVSLPPQLTDGMTFPTTSDPNSTPAPTAGATAASTTTSTAGAPRLAAMPLAGLFALPGHFLSMAEPTVRQRF